MVRVSVTEPGGAVSFRTQQPAAFSGVGVPGLGVTLKDAGTVGVSLGGALKRVSGGTVVTLTIDAKAVGLGGIVAFESQLAKLEAIIPDEVAREEL